MSAAHVGFRLIPGGFFARNPALDVPRPMPNGACDHGGSTCHSS